jgi:hypothetical protein
VPVVVPTAVPGQEWTLQATTFGESLNHGSLSNVTLKVNSLKPYSPVHLNAVRDGSDNVTIRWVRRTRIGGGLSDWVDVPLREASEAYEVKLYDGVLLKRSWRVTEPRVVYSAAEQLADFGTVPSSISVTVSQLSELVGPGNLAGGVLTIQN